MSKSQQYRPMSAKPLSMGLKTSRSGLVLGDGHSARATNVEFDRDTVAFSRGSKKLNNQVARRPCLRTRVDPAYSPLSIEAGKSAPLRGYVFHRYDELYDIGGDFVAAGSFPSQTFHTRRGRSFSLKVSFEVPPEEALFERDHRGAQAGTGVSGIEDVCGYDEGLDDCTLILQKGGDGTTPMSWAIGIVNTGQAFEALTGEAEGPRPSNYALVFMWLDAPEWGESSPSSMRYDLTTPTGAPSGSYSTQALRAVICEKFVEPGATYHLAVQLTLDSVLPTDVTPWANDGVFGFQVIQDDGDVETFSFQDSGGGGVANGVHVWKGPTDSLRYLCKYGIRYSGRDPMFTGLGYRTAPWNEQGFIPFGMDSAAMEKRGFRMADCSDSTVNELYGSGSYTLVSNAHGASDAYLQVDSCRGLVQNNANLRQSPLGLNGVVWQGFGGEIASGAPVSTYNPSALRGYRVVFPQNSVVPALNGGVASILTYDEIGVDDYRLTVEDGANLSAWASDMPLLIRAFRWNQRDMLVQDVRIYSAARAYTDPRRAFSLRSSVDLDDETEPDIDTLLAYWPLDDAGGASCRELVRGKTAFLAPYGLGVSEEGSEGKNAIFLSGEGEALTLDLSENPVWEREFERVLKSESGGFAVELSFIMPQAYYAVDESVPSPPANRELEAKYAPYIASWAVKGADEAGTTSPALPLMSFGHHAFWSLTQTTAAARRPMGFHLDVLASGDQSNDGMTSAAVGITEGASPGNWDSDAPWVGKRITVQFGIEPTADNRSGTTAREFRCYLAATPKQDLRFAAGDASAAEFAYYVETVVTKKDLLRSIVTIGGAWNPDVRGYTEYSCRMILDKVRVYGATAPGALPSTSGQVTPEGTGKILGRNSMPQRELELSDILRPLGAGLETISLNAGLTSHDAPAGTVFFDGNPEDSLDAIRERFLLPRSDRQELPSDSEVREFIEQFYFIGDVPSGSEQLTTETPYEGPSTLNSSALVFSMVGYTAFSSALDDLRRLVLTLGSGSPYEPGVTETKDLVVTQEVFFNLAPVTGNWRLRIASPFTRGGVANVLPAWSGGLVAPRSNPITGVYGLDEQIVASSVGQLSLVDDRWREDGPTETLRRSIEVRGYTIGDTEALFPLRRDVVEFPNYENAWPYWSTALYSGYTWVWDFWVKIDEAEGLQSLAWIGCTATDLQRLPGATAALRGVGIWLRLNQGRPEFVRASSSTYDGVSRPTDGEYVASSSDAVPVSKWTHVRFYLEHYNDGSNEIAKIPGICINGRPTTVSVNATDNAATVASDDWLLANNGGGIINISGDARNTLYIGVSRDSWRAIKSPNLGMIDELAGQETFPDRVTGLLHALNGRVCGVRIWRALRTNPLVQGYPAFDPYSIDYASGLVRFRADMQEGVGHKVKDAVVESQGAAFENIPGLIRGHPFVDLYHEFGTSDEPTSFAAFNQRVYAANGGRPAYIDADGGGPAGVLPPTTRPTFDVERLPLWVPNAALTDPGEFAAAGADDQVNHLSTYGNNYLTQAYHEEMDWSKDDSGSPDVMDVVAVKGYWKPRSVVGRFPLWARRNGKNSGSLFIENRDGYCYVGWYDVYLKKCVWVRTSQPVFRPGRWYYINVRKSFPLQDNVEGNWLNSFYSNGRRRRAQFTETAGTWEVGDVIQNGAATSRGFVTKVDLTAGTGWIEYVLFTGHTDFTATTVVNDGTGATGTIDTTPFHLTGDALIVGEFHPGSYVATQPTRYATTVIQNQDRTCVSFTTSDFVGAGGTTASGAVTPRGPRFNGAINGFVTAADVQLFHEDHLGMLWQWGAGTGDSNVYYITGVASSITIEVRDSNGNIVDFSGAQYQNAQGSVFFGTTLVKSDEFDDSTSPDEEAYDVQLMGSPEALDPTSGISRNSGEFDSWGWVVLQTNALGEASSYSDCLLFESGGASRADDCEIGTDLFAGLIIGVASRPEQLHFDAGQTFAVFHGQPYSGAADDSTQPNAELEVAMDTEASLNAESLFWKYLEQTEITAGQRRISVVFRDLTQGVRSNPGPVLVVEPTQEDLANPSGTARVLLRNLPVSAQPGTIHREVYMSLADGYTMFLVATIPDNISSSVGVELREQDIVRGRVIEYRNGAPPDCYVLGLSQSVMFYGDLTLNGIRQPDAIRFSLPFFPARVPRENFMVIVGGKSQDIRAMADLNGKLLVFKRDAFYAVTVRQGAAFQEMKSSNVGAVGPQAVAVLDNTAYWVADRGFYAYAGSGKAAWLGENVHDLFTEENADQNVDPRYTKRMSAAISRARDQFIATFRALEDVESRRRLATEFDNELSGAGISQSMPALHRYSLYEDPNVTALSSVDRLGGGVERMVAGTEEGFVIFIDRRDTALHLAGADPELYNPPTVTLGAGSTTTELVLSATTSYLADLEGIRGASLRWVEGGVETRAVALFSDGDSIFLDRAVASAPASGVVVTIGAIRHDWESKWFDMQAPFWRKKWHYLDLVMEPQASGTATLNIYVDFESTPTAISLNGVATTDIPVDLTESVFSIPLQELNSRHFKLRIKTDPPSYGQSFELTELVLRARDVEAH